MLQNEGTLCTCVWCVCVCVVAHDRWQSSKLRSTGRVKPGTKAEKCRDVFSDLFFSCLVSRLLAASVSTPFRNWRDGLD